MKTALITGVNGFLGSHLAAELARRGWRVRGTTSAERGLNLPRAGVERKFVLALGGAPAAEIFAGVDAVIHCAYDLRPRRIEQNVAGTKRVAAAAADAGVKYQMFISSYSAHAQAVTEYGRTKYLLQEDFLTLGQAVARPGLVIGPGGMFGRMMRAFKLPITPLPDGGRDRAPIVALADCIAALAAIAEEGRRGRFNLFNPDLVTLEELFTAAREISGSRTIFVPLPAPLLAAGARLMEKLRLAPPADAESFAALKANQRLSERSDLDRFVERPQSLAEMVAAAHRDLARRGPTP